MLADAADGLRQLQAQENLPFADICVALDAIGNRMVRQLKDVGEPLAQLPLLKVTERLRFASVEVRAFRPPSGARRTKTILLTSEFVRQLHHSLFPAERMLVVAGRNVGDLARVTAAYEVTGQRSSGHVTADRPALNRALIDMEVSGAFSILWAHSHPGRGPWTVQPSTLDLQQQAEWGAYYSPALTGVVMSEDGYFRFFGDSYQRGAVSIEFEGNGIVEVEEGEIRVYRIA